MNFAADLSGLIRVPNFEQKIISRKTKQHGTDHCSSEFRLFRETKNLRNSVPSNSAEGENKRGWGAESEGANEGGWSRRGR